MVEVGTWKNFDDIEESLILDELLLLTEQLNKKRRHEMRIIMLSQGVDIEDEEPSNKDDEDLPEEVLAAERAYREEKERKKLEKAIAGEMVPFGEGLGYEVVS